MVGEHLTINPCLSLPFPSLLREGRETKGPKHWAGVVSSGERTILACWEEGHPIRRTKRRKARTTLVYANPVPDAPQKPGKITLYTKR